MPLILSTLSTSVLLLFYVAVANYLYRRQMIGPDCIDLFGCVHGRVPNSTLVPRHGLLQTRTNACLQSPLCLAIDNDVARNSCYILTDANMLKKLQQVDGFFHYPLLYRCPRPVDSQYRHLQRMRRQVTPIITGTAQNDTNITAVNTTTPASFNATTPESFNATIPESFNATNATTLNVTVPTTVRPTTTPATTVEPETDKPTTEGPTTAARVKFTGQDPSDDYMTFKYKYSTLTGDDDESRNNARRNINIFQVSYFV
ncbi:hypothetical protein LSAT2_007749 [Lamellibrachia satsuma]|nr:hypothetical protein LSAT2_007749 [Lamellibrachia satsuma]